MLSDPNEDVRKLAVDKILEYRQSEKPDGVRIRILPALNKNAKNYYEMIGNKSQHLWLWLIYSQNSKISTESTKNIV